MGMVRTSPECGMGLPGYLLARTLEARASAEATVTPGLLPGNPVWSQAQHIAQVAPLALVEATRLIVRDELCQWPRVRRQPVSRARVMDEQFQSMTEADRAERVTSPDGAHPRIHESAGAVPSSVAF